MTTDARLLIIETLLNALEAERHTRMPLLLTVLDELSLNVAFEPALDRARDLCAMVVASPEDHVGFAVRVGELHAVVRELARGRTAPLSRANGANGERSHRPALDGVR